MNMMDLKFIKDNFSKFKLLVIIFFLINLIFFLNLIFFNKFEYFYIPSIKKIEFNGQVNSFYIKSIKNILITFDRISFSKFHSIEILNYNKKMQQVVISRRYSCFPTSLLPHTVQDLQSA